MIPTLDDILNGKRLSVAESSALLLALLTEPVNGARLAAVVAALRVRGVTLDELDGFSAALLSVAKPVDLSPFEVIDVCGTGGDNRGTFNISTASAFVLAGAGYKVAKHGNYAVSSRCGSSDVLEALGVQFTDQRDTLLRSLERAGVCFLHAPLFHPTLRRAAQVRRALGVRTVFNMLGPLINPARPSFQMNGVYDLALLRLYGALFQRRGVHGVAVYGLDGCDEVSLAAPTQVVWPGGCREITAADVGLPEVSLQQLAAPASAQESAQLLRAVVAGEATEAQQAAVIATAAVAIWCQHKLPLQECAQVARHSIASGAALRSLQACTDE
jgi:anthranilate phosphoribosyltransferase